WSALHEVAEVRSDNTEILDVQTGLNVVEIDIFTNQSGNTLLNGMWNDHYRGIAQCNIILSRIDAIDMDAALKNRYIGEVKFLRSLMYFNMVRTLKYMSNSLQIFRMRNPNCQ
ncbi:MAG: RagB/SusD family nutrient uptake outer membrane protein, partial [Flavihumibacter sp.]|nr:RagB/SusD family nutrient uptake outer membrane protein [Flavihumibacter sp.]